MNSRPESVPDPLLPSADNQALHGLLKQLDQTQWWPAAQMAAGQLQQLKSILGYAILYSPFYRQHLKGLDIRDLDFDGFSKLPILSRSDLQTHNEQLDCTQLPESHGKISETMTSGSTATPVKLRSTGLSATIWDAINLREQIWHRRDSSKTIASIRWHADAVGLAPNGIKFEDWGFPINLFYKSAPSYFLNSSSDISSQLAWLKKINPSYLLSHPSNLRALIEEAKQRSISFPNLQEVRTVGEAVNEDLREFVRESLSVKLTDFYSAQELGYIALQCPDFDHYHVQSESVIVEVVREDGSPCDLDEPGRILITSLRNYATPLIRYDIGDYGELSGPCDCGRGLPVLKRIQGRVRNMLRLPDGGSSWPNFGFRKIMEVTALKQFQLVQDRLDHIELKLVLDEKPSGHSKQDQEQKIKSILLEHLGDVFEVDITYHDSIARSAGGKFEDFICLLKD